MIVELKKPAVILLLLLFIGSPVFSETTIGTGLLSVKFDDKTTITFYNTPSDKLPAQKIQFFNDTKINSSNIVNLNMQRKWLEPEVLWLDYDQLVFRIIEKKGSWIKIIVNNRTGKFYWIKSGKEFTIMSWAVFLKNMFGVSRKDHQKILQMPSTTAPEVYYKGEDCFRVKSMKGDWIEISSANYCDDGYTKSKTKIKSGWIRWRLGNKLLISYTITS